MTDSTPVTPPPGAPAPATKEKMPVWAFRTILGAVAAVVLVLGYLIGSVTVPLMWATSIRDQIGGQLGNSIPLGMFYGFVFSFVPVLLAWQVRRRNLNKWVRIALAAAAVLLTIPNLLTLGVLYGGTQTAADARSIWANSANWFGTWSQVFMLVGVVCAVAIIVLGRMWLRRGRKIREIKAAEKLVRENQQAKDKEAKAAARAAEKESRAAGRKQPVADAPAPGTDPQDTGTGSGAPQA